MFAILLVLLLWVLPIQDWKNGPDRRRASRSSASRCLRRQVARETPVVAGERAGRGRRASASSGMRESFSPAAPSRTDELERLANLHAPGALTDEEFAAAKADLLAKTAG